MTSGASSWFKIDAPEVATIWPRVNHELRHGRGWSVAVSRLTSPKCLSIDNNSL